jgi:hypothetical protein
MYQKITKDMFRDEFQRKGRGARFSYEALGALYDYLVNIDDAYELDVIGLCCDYTEDKIANVFKYQNLDSLNALRSNTFVIWSNKTHVLYADY